MRKLWNEQDFLYNKESVPNLLVLRFGRNQFIEMKKVHTNSVD